MGSLDWDFIYLGYRKNLSPTLRLYTFSTCYGGQWIVTMDLYVQNNNRDLSSFYDIVWAFCHFIQFYSTQTHVQISKWKLQKTSLPSRHWLGVKSLKWADFLWSKSRNVWPKNNAILVLASLDWRDYIDFSKLSPSLKHQKALDIRIANLKGDLLTVEISPSRNSTLFFSILQLLYKVRRTLLLEHGM